MDNTTLAILAVICLSIGVPILIKVFGLIPSAKAKMMLNQNATLLDVRTAEEFRSGHVKGAVHVPYEEVGQRIGAIAPNKSAPILLYCLSGGRSGVAKSTLRRMGYLEAHNLGSLARAKRIVES